MGPGSDVSIASLVRLLLSMSMEIWDCERGPFREMFAVFAILGPVGNTISPWGKGPSRNEVAFLLAYDQGSIDLESLICSSGLAEVTQLTVHGT